MLVRGAQSQLDVLNKDCKSQISAAFVTESFRGQFKPTHSTGIDYEGSQHAEAPISAVQQICAMGEPQSAAVRAKVKRIDIRWGGTGKSTYTFENGVVTGIINPAGGTSAFDYRALIRGPEGLRRQL